jgi:hypothetical protein
MYIYIFVSVCVYVFMCVCVCVSLYLAYKNLQYLHPDTFLVLPNIQHVYSYSSQGLRIQNDRKFINSLSLSKLDISLWKVCSLAVETFIKVILLEYIDLSDNNVCNVDINILRALPKLSTLYLYGNRLQCDCQLKEVWRWCEERNIRTGDVICDTPSEVEGMWWGVFKLGQFLERNMALLRRLKIKATVTLTLQASAPTQFILSS